MAYTERFVAADGTTGPFVIGFNYLQGETLVVYLSEADGSNAASVPFSFAGTPTDAQPSGTTVVLASPALAGKQLHIVKLIDMDSPVINWLAGTALDADNLQHMTVNLMEMAQAAHDNATGSRDIAQQALDVAQATDTSVGAQLAAQDSQMQSLADAAEAHATEAEYWAGISQAGAAVANPSGVAEAARDAAIAARDAAIAARDLAEQYKLAADAAAALATAAKDTAVLARDKSEAWAETAQGIEVDAGKYSAKHYAETAQDIVDAGATLWHGSAKFVSTAAPDPALGVNGDFWFQREL